MPKTIIHIGPPKTGTTTLQELVFTRLSRVCFLGKPWWNPEVPYDRCVALHHAIDHVTKSSPADYDEAPNLAAVNAWLATSPAAQALPDGSFLPRLLSEERLCFTDHVSMGEIARRLSVLFPGAEIVYVKRDQVPALQSFHRWLYARCWINSGFSDWLEEAMKPGAADWGTLALRCYDWPLIHAAFAQHFPVVRSVHFNDMLSDTCGFLTRFFGFEDSDFACCDWLNHQPKNVSPNRAVAELHRLTKRSIRLWNRLPFHHIDEKKEYLGDTRFWKIAEAPLRRLRLGEDKLSATTQDRQLILDYYASREEPPRNPQCHTTRAHQ